MASKAPSTRSLSSLTSCLRQLSLSSSSQRNTKPITIFPITPRTQKRTIWGIPKRTDLVQQPPPTIPRSSNAGESAGLQQPSSSKAEASAPRQLREAAGPSLPVLLSSLPPKRNGKPYHHHASSRHSRSAGIRVHRPPRSTQSVCADPIGLITKQQIAQLDPTGARTRLFDPLTGPDAIRVGDVVMVRRRAGGAGGGSGEPFAGVLIQIRRRGADTAILLRGMLTRVGVEVWFKIYSPAVEAIELVRRRDRRARRARLTYLRKERHDNSSLVEGWVRQYLRDGVVRGGEKEVGRGKVTKI